ncbi:UDP-glycosyltransferase 85A3 [Morella rubra]|uniref:UDP-glycosyltransferase 85A3 n=1 Tax=Morella rubra TaxID=262757 RepID=A0A6A1VQ05_9ROSI|nr:UDP-glycosyltransferase 85A3 [Morella rubra]KAB1222866.1 UDP-glycosyltransferase 85A3 [Morella rubra]
MAFRSPTLISWPFFAEQQTNCRYSCKEWGLGMEIEGDVNRAQIESLVRELMMGVKGRELKQKAVEWKKLAEESTRASTGPSHENLDKLIDLVLLSPRVG